MIMLSCIHTHTQAREILNNVVIILDLLEAMEFEEKKWTCLCVCACVARVYFRGRLVLIYADMGGKEE